MRKLLSRADVPQELTWNAESVFPSILEWERECDALVVEIEKLASYQGKLTDSADQLLEALSLSASLQVRVAKLGVYSHTSYGVDTNNQAAAKLDARNAFINARLSAANSFIAPELLQAEQKVRDFARQSSALEPYTHYFDDLFRGRAHIRSSEVEQILGMVSEPFSSVETTYTMLTSAEFSFGKVRDFAGAEHPVFQGTIGAQMHSYDRTLRKHAWEAFADTFLAFKGTLTSNYLTSVKQNVFTARVRGFDSCLGASLFGSNIPKSVFFTLIDVFKRSLPIWHRYWKVRKAALGVSQLAPYDIWAPITQERPKISLSQAIQWICEGMAPLGNEYVEAMRRGCTEERWLDTVPSIGKRAGAWSGGSFGTHPFIVMGYSDDLESLSTLAHELGHSMHSYLSWKNQPSIYGNYTIFAAEVASNFDQALVREHLFNEKKGDTNFQIALIEEAMSNFHRYLFIMPTLARFEYEVHTRIERGGSLASEDLVTLMYELFSEGYGEEVAAEKERIGITWAQFPHLYMPFYVFQYATGISAAHALASQTLSSPSAAQRYLAFLKAGSSKYPADALTAAGCDLTKPEPIERAFSTLENYIERLEKLVS